MSNLSLVREAYIINFTNLVQYAGSLVEMLMMNAVLSTKP